jgi:glycosyltransferase involved in cell wall biosynthesis
VSLPNGEPVERPALLAAGKSSFTLDNQASSDLAAPRKLRVLVVTNLWPYEGDPSYGCFVQSQMESLRPLGVEYDVLFINGRASRWNYARALPQFWRRLREKRYDLIHAHMGLAGWVARCQRRVPLVVTFHGNDVPGKVNRSGRTTFYGHLLQISSIVLARLVRSVIVQSEEMKRILRLDSARVIPCGVDLALFHPMARDEARRALGLDPKKKFVFFPYRPAEERKRYDLVEAVVKRVREQVPEIEILLVNRVPPPDVPLYINAADVMVMASMMEGSPCAVKESMAANLPVVSVAVGDTPQLLGSSEGNYLVPRDVERMAEKVVEICLSGKRSRGRELVERLSMEKIARQVLEVYLAAVGPAARELKVGFPVG